MLIHGDCLEKLKELPENSVDSIVTDPPYGLSFMGKKWDYDVPSKEVWVECLRVLKPGGYLLSFAGTRTQHRMAVNIEDAGFEIRDMITWVYGSGFPKSLNIGKAVDKLQGNEREITDIKEHTWNQENNSTVSSKNGQGGTRRGLLKDEQYAVTKGNSEWEGWGTALKPALEPITVARKPLSEKTVAENVLKWGTGGINIDGSRVETEDNLNDGGYNTKGTSQKDLSDATSYATKVMDKEFVQPQGRFPANLIHDGSDEVVSLFPDSKSTPFKMKRMNDANIDKQFMGSQKYMPDGGFGDSGSAARFFYCAKASKADRDEGEVRGGGGRVADGYTEETNDLKEAARKFGAVKSAKRNTHPTVKPTKLMQYLVKLVTPKGGVVLDPFMGSGSTGKACKLEGFDFIGIEREEEYLKIAEARINAINTLF